MIAFDTNYLVRHLVQDDRRQCKVVAAAIAEAVEARESVWLSELVLCETVWVLVSAYRASRQDVVQAIRALHREAVFELEEPERVERALMSYEKGKADFSDYVLWEKCREQGIELRSFDKQLMRELSG